MTDELLALFSTEHLPPWLQAIVDPFAKLAQRIVDTVPDCDDRRQALLELRDAKDYAKWAIEIGNPYTDEEAQAEAKPSDEMSEIRTLVDDSNMRFTRQLEREWLNGPDTSTTHAVPVWYRVTGSSAIIRGDNANEIEAVG
jgi:hypothetical protein